MYSQEEKQKISVNWAKFGKTDTQSKFYMKNSLHTASRDKKYEKSDEKLIIVDNFENAKQACAKQK